KAQIGEHHPHQASQALVGGERRERLFGGDDVAVDCQRQQRREGRYQHAVDEQQADTECELPAIRRDVRQQAPHHALVVIADELLALFVEDAVALQLLASRAALGAALILGLFNRVVRQVHIDEALGPRRDARAFLVVCHHAASRSASSCWRLSISAYQPPSSTSSSWDPCSTTRPW